MSGKLLEIDKNDPLSIFDVSVEGLILITIKNSSIFLNSVFQAQIRLKQAHFNFCEMKKWLKILHFPTKMTIKKLKKLDMFRIKREIKLSLDFLLAFSLKYPQIHGIPSISVDIIYFSQ